MEKVNFNVCKYCTNKIVFSDKKTRCLKKSVCDSIVNPEQEACDKYIYNAYIRGGLDV